VSGIRRFFKNATHTGKRTGRPVGDKKIMDGVPFLCYIYGEVSTMTVGVLEKHFAKQNFRKQGALRNGARNIERGYEKTVTERSPRYSPRPGVGGAEKRFCEAKTFGARGEQRQKRFVMGKAFNTLGSRALPLLNLTMSLLPSQ
jgi:hypothetical protein